MVMVSEFAIDSNLKIQLHLNSPESIAISRICTDEDEMIYLNSCNVANLTIWESCIPAYHKLYLGILWLESGNRIPEKSIITGTCLIDQRIHGMVEYNVDTFACWAGYIYIYIIWDYPISHDLLELDSSSSSSLIVSPVCICLWTFSFVIVILILSCSSV